MPTRRFVLGAGLAAAGFSASGLATSGLAPATASAGALAGKRADYEAAAAQLREALSDSPQIPDFLRAASLAPNGHNTQPWRFAVARQAITLLPDFSRRTPVVDPDDHHLFVSLGCALENLAIATARHGAGLRLAVRDGQDAPLAELEGGTDPADPALYEAIFQRQSTRADYDGKPIAAESLRRLEAAARLDGVEMQLVTEPGRIDDILDFLLAGNSAQVADPAFVDELVSWIRFDAGEALDHRDGLFTACSGNPALPGWLGRRLFRFVFTDKGETEKYVRQMRSTPAVAIFTASGETAADWVAVGRSFERFALTATALGLAHAHINQVVEVPGVREAFADWLGLPGRRPDLVIRLGHGPRLPMSLRRPPPLVPDA